MNMQTKSWRGYTFAQFYRANKRNYTKIQCWDLFNKLQQLPL